MTPAFELFFNKKKINLTALKQFDELRYFELKKHFDLMGEKSFDYSNKFIFNNLRKIFPIKD